MGNRCNWTQIQHFYDESGSRAAACARFGIRPVAWNRAVVTGRLRLNGADARKRALGPGNRKFDWHQIQQFHDAGNDRRACAERFGFREHAWYNAVKNGLLQRRSLARLPRPSRPLDQILKSSCRSSMKRGLLKLGILVNRCDDCGITEWRGKPLAVQIDHRNGIKNDNRLENLRMLCPNCHSQTETFAARNWKNQSRVAKW